MTPQMRALVEALKALGIYGPNGRWHLDDCNGMCTRRCKNARAALTTVGESAP